jgi:hypothetical protein
LYDVAILTRDVSKRNIDNATAGWSSVRTGCKSVCHDALGAGFETYVRLFSCWAASHLLRA